MAAVTSTLYPASDLSEREWAMLAPLLLPPKPGGRPRTVDLRRIVDGLFFVLLLMVAQLQAQLAAAQKSTADPVVAAKAAA